VAKQVQARIISTGIYLPERIFTNSDFEKIVDTTDEWIVSRTGIRERRIAGQDEFTSDMGTAAAQDALKKAGMTAADIDLILVATMTPDYTSSSTASIIQAKLGANCVASLDIQAACSGYLYTLATAKAYIESGMYRNVLVVAAEKMSSFIDYTDRSTCILFGDGAAASIVSNQGEGLFINAVTLGSDGEMAELIVIPAGGSRLPATAKTVSDKMHYFKMAGKETFKHAVRRMVMASNQCLEKAGIEDRALSWLIPHQANIRILEAVAKSFHIPEERMVKTVHKYGNTSASSIPLALYELVERENIGEHEHILLVAFGAGLTWGAIVLTKIMK